MQIKYDHYAQQKLLIAPTTNQAVKFEVLGKTTG